MGLLALTALLGACSMARLAYDQAPLLAQWRLERDLQLDPQQATLARQGIDTWFAWHRQVELPVYAQWLAEVRSQMGDDLNASQACRWWDDARAAMDRAMQASIPGMAALAVTLSPRQIQHLAQRQRERLDELREEYTGDEASDQRARRIVARAQRLYGTLDASQTEAIQALVMRSRWDDEHWLTQREARQERLFEVLHQVRGVTVRDAEAVLADALVSVMQQPPATLHRTVAQRHQGCETVARVHNLTTPEQRKIAVTRLQGWEEDLRRLGN